jgi:hypothetical protein
MNVSSDMHKMINAAGKLRKNGKVFMNRVERPWRPHTAPKESTWNRMQWTLRQMECRSGGLTATVAKKVATTILTPIVHYSAEIWHGCDDEHKEIDDAALATWASLLGVSIYGTKHCAIRAELGALTMSGQRDIQSLAYYNRLINMPSSRLTRQVFDWLLTDCDTDAQSPAQENWVKTTIPKIMKKYDIAQPEEGIAKKEWRKSVYEKVLEKEEAFLQDELKAASQKGGTLEDLSKYGSTIEEPKYLQTRNSWPANRGRELKTRFRIKGKYAFVTDNDTRKQISAGHACPCCGHGAETPFHFTRQCREFKDERRVMDCRIADAIREDDKFSYSLKTENQKFAFLMSSGVSPENPKFAQWRKIELALYEFLGVAQAKRKKILADRLPDRQGSISFQDGLRAPRLD